MSYTGYRSRMPRKAQYFSEEFIEGMLLNFKILKRITLNETDQYYLLESPGRHRFLLPAKYYPYLDVPINSDIICEIDKINCSGRIFLEPLHPVFKAKEYYWFEVVHSRVTLDKKERPVTTYLLKDKQEGHHKAQLLSNITFRNGSKIIAAFEKTRKGILILSEIQVINNC